MGDAGAGWGCLSDVAGKKPLWKGVWWSGHIECGESTGEYQRKTNNACKVEKRVRTSSHKRLGS